MAVLEERGRQQCPGAGLRPAGGWFLRQAENSAICTFVWREGRIPRAWPHSIACRLFTAIINIPCALFKAVYRAGKRVWDASLFCRLIGALGGASFLFLGLFMMVMLMTPMLCGTTSTA